MKRWQEHCLLALLILALGCSPEPEDSGTDVLPDTQLSMQEMRERLQALGYASAGRETAPQDAGSPVRFHDPARSEAGLNFFTIGTGPGAVLMGMDGRILHRWKKSIRQVWPSLQPRGREATFWRHAKLLPNGDVLAIFDGFGIFKIDRYSRLVWANQNGAHHDIELTPGGNILVLTREARLLPNVHASMPTLEDFVVTLDADGNEVNRVSLLSIFENSEELMSWRERHDEFWALPKGNDAKWAEWTRGDVYHTNSITRLDGRWSGLHPAFSAGNWLVSFRNLDTIAVIDPQQEKLVWTMTGPFKEQHDPSFTSDGRLMVFNNFRAEQNSSVMLFDPITRELLWEYRGQEGEQFHTAVCGTSRQLPNGNLLITETEGSRVIELTRTGEIVWDYHVAERARNGRRAAIYDVVRFPSDFGTAWIGR